MKAADEAAVPFTVTVFSASEKTAVSVWQDTDKTYYLFLPAYCDTQELTVHLPNAADVAIDGTAIGDGDATDALTVGDHTLTADGKEYKLRVLRSEAFPSVWLETESGSMENIRADKNHKEKGTFTLVDHGSVMCDGLALKSIKGRGNSTWAADKKPLNIKFEEKTDVLGMGKAKKWSLLANHFDASLLRNSLALNIAEAIGLPYTPSYRMVDLYINGE
ncbi:MAG: CotH kinase family protein, partial [Clostridia bacterium]|nr:CotH kinase family protein [Clostridia bacterium]